MRKGIYLFIAFVLPGLLFVFLKYFGKNEFHVEPLFVVEGPAPVTECGAVILPYFVPDSVMKPLLAETDSLALILFDGLSDAVTNTQWNRMQREVQGGVVHFKHYADTSASERLMRQCSFLLREPFNAVLVDRSGVIRGQYNLADREEADRLIMEVAIILKKY